jgi:hypothetical protein
LAKTFDSTPEILTRWLVPTSNGRRLCLGVVLALLLHAGLFAFFHWMTPPQEISVLESYHPKKAPVTVTLMPKPPRSRPATPAEAEPTPPVLTQNQKKTRSTIAESLVPKSLTPPQPKPQQVPESRHAPSRTQEHEKSFLPPSNEDYIASLREEGAKSGKITADGGDLPIENDTPAPAEGPTPLPRHEVKDLGLFQFSQAFRQRFAAYWNMKERWAPPQSPVLPGDVIYYKVYLNGDGTLERFENLTARDDSGKNYSDVDAIFRDVIEQVLPMPIPTRLKGPTGERVVVTQVIAIQVVGRNLPIQFSF